MKREKRDRVPILDPIPGEFAPAACLDPPSEAEVWDKVPKFKNGCPPFYETQRNNVRILIEKIGEKVDPVQDLSRWPAPASSSTATTSARSTTTSSTGRTTRSRSTTSITGSRSSTSTRTTSAAAAARRSPPRPR